MADHRYAIVGLGVIPGPTPGKSVRALEAEAARLAIEDAGLDRKDIHGAVQLRRSAGGGDRASYADGFPRMLGLPVRFYYSVARGGSQAGLGIGTALSFLDRGIADHIVLSGGVTDWSSVQRARQESGTRGMQHAEREGYWGRPVGDLRAPSHHSWMASRHMAVYGTTSRQLGAIAVQTRAWANLNPEAHMYGKPMTIEDHQSSPLVVEPYHLFDICLLSDGAVSFVLTTAEHARSAKRKPVWVHGVGFGEVMDELWWEKKNFESMAVKTAKEQAFGQAGITLEDVDAAQFYDCFTSEVLFQLEGYGYCEKGEGGKYVEAGHIGPDGDTPVNTSGGLLSCYHLGDLTHLAEAVRQLRGEAGKRQVKDAEVMLVTGHGGEVVSPGMCSIHSTLVLGRD